jgi:hypothetical protein
MLFLLELLGKIKNRAYKKSTNAIFNQTLKITFMEN